MKPHEEHPAPWTVHWDGYARCYRLTDDVGDISQLDAAEAYNSLAAYAEELEGRNALTAEKTNAEDVRIEATKDGSFSDPGICNRTMSEYRKAKPRPEISQCPDCGAIKRKSLRLCQRCLDSRSAAERANALHNKNILLAKEVNRLLSQRDIAWGVAILLAALTAVSLVLR